MRESTARGPAIDLSEFERRLRAPESAAAPRKNDPLSELARLMHGGAEAPTADPYGRILDAAPHEEPASPQGWTPHSAAAPRPASDIYAGELRGTFAGDSAARGAASEAPYDLDATRFGDGRRAESAPHDYAGYDQPADPAWSGQASDYLDYGHDDDAAAQGNYDEDPPRGARRWNFRPWHAVAAVAAIGLVSVGWTFAHRSGVVGSRDIALITAPEGPMKVAPAAVAAKDEASQGAAILDRKESAQVKQVVGHEEQAVDPKVAPRAVQLGSGPVDAPHEAGPLAPLEPRKVKTVSVRPDGTVISDDHAPPAVIQAPAQSKESSALSAKGGTPTSVAKPVTTPRAAQAQPKDKPKSEPKAEPKVAAVEDNAADNAADDAGDAPESKATISKGGYAVQFAAAGSESEARGVMAKVASKYASQLGGHKPTFKIAKVGDKTVYRVRVHGVSKESAVAICEKVKASGGSCFVAGN